MGRTCSRRFLLVMALVALSAGPVSAQLTDAAAPAPIKTAPFAANPIATAAVVTGSSIGSPPASRPIAGPIMRAVYAPVPQPGSPSIIQTAASDASLLAPEPPTSDVWTASPIAPSPFVPPPAVAPARVAPAPVAPNPYETKRPDEFGRPLMLSSGQFGKPVSTIWSAEVLPTESIYKEYLADPKAARFASQILNQTGDDTIWSLRAGGRAPLFRYGTPSGTVGRSGRPEGWQVGVEGVATPRLNFDHELDLDFVDFRVGVPITYSEGNWQYKLEVYHLSSHVGDELLIRDPAFNRINYVRDAIRVGAGYFVNPDLRLYGEGEWAFNIDGGADPFHFQFGADYSPLAPTVSLLRPQPFWAINAGLRQEVDFGGGLNVLGGLQWRGAASDNVFRAGIQYYNGKSFQYQQFDEHEELLGLGIWYDF